MHKLSLVTVVITLAAAAGCTMSQTEAPPLTGPAQSATSLDLSASPDTIAMGQSFSAAGQQSVITVRVFDATGKPKANQPVRFDTLVNNKLSDCGQLSQAALITGADGRASTVFTAPGTPPDCPNFSSDGSVTVRAIASGTDFQSSSGSAANVSLFMALPTFVNPVGSFVVNFSISPNPGKTAPAVVNFSDAGSMSPGHSITSYKWTWSDGASKNGAFVSHDFSTAGTYTATLAVTDDIGQTSFKTALVQIEN